MIWEAKESTGARSCFQISVAVWQHLWRPCSPNPAHGRSPAAGCPVPNNDALSYLSALWGSPVQKRCGHAGVSLAAPPWWLGGRGGSAWGRGEHKEPSLLSAATPSQCPEMEPDPSQRCSVLVGKQHTQTAKHSEPRPDVGEGREITVRVVKYQRGPRGVVGSPSWATSSDLELLQAVEPGWAPEVRSDWRYSMTMILWFCDSVILIDIFIV